MPKYIQRGGEVVQPFPYTASSTRQFTFALEADRDRLEEIVDAELNRDPDHRTWYVPLGSSVLVTFAQFEDFKCSGPVGGVMNDHDVAIFIPVLRVSPLHGPPIAVRLYSRHNFVGVSGSQVAGREVFGFNKALSTLEFDPPALGGALANSVANSNVLNFKKMTLSTDVVPKDPTDRVDHQPLITVEASSGVTAPSSGTSSVFTLNQAQDWIRALVALAFNTDGTFLLGSANDLWGLTIDALEAATQSVAAMAAMSLYNPFSFTLGLSNLLMALNPWSTSHVDYFDAPRTVGLKQFMHSRYPHRSRWCGPVETNFDLEPTWLKPIDGPFKVTFHHWLSHQLVTDLGVKTGANKPPVPGTWSKDVRFAVGMTADDFQVEKGHAIWCRKS